ncbi:MAG TPA: ABC transporter permease [Candidatus Acidoferrum sp.]|nr:ABC transporter permease [Candidatus Acidoferrum sp.]
MAAPAMPRRYGAVNWRGLWALCLKDLHRAYKSFRYSVLGPVVSNLLFLAIFAVARGSGAYVGDLTFLQFLVPGLVIFAVCETAYSTSSESLLFDKMEGMIADTLMAPLTPTELTIGYACSSAATGLLTGAAVALPMLLVVPLPIASLPLLLFFAAGGAFMHGLLGILVGLWAERWDHHSAALTFIVIPFGYLSGTFYSVASLPALAESVARVNPVFYVIDGFRAASTGHAESPPLVGMVVVALVVLGLGVCARRLFRIGYKLKP